MPKDDRPELYDFITEIVDVVHELRPDLTRDAVERMIGPTCATVVLRCVQTTLNEVSKELSVKFRLVDDIARFVRDSLIRGA